tara:strand:- start:210 stop:524 length:315 start_codon:yes stop_codon:yes gene_type:complete
MAVTIDPRPTYFGDRMIVTGSYEDGDTSIDLSSLLISIDFVGITQYAANQRRLETGDNADASDGALINIPDTATVAANGTTITINTASATTTAGAKFIAIGRRS